MRFSARNRHSSRNYHFAGVTRMRPSLRCQLFGQALRPTGLFRGRSPAASCRIVTATTTSQRTYCNGIFSTRKAAINRGQTAHIIAGGRARCTLLRERTRNPHGIRRQRPHHDRKKRARVHSQQTDDDQAGPYSPIPNVSARRGGIGGDGQPQCSSGVSDSPSGVQSQTAFSTSDLPATSNAPPCQLIRASH